MVGQECQLMKEKSGCNADGNKFRKLFGRAEKYVPMMECDRQQRHSSIVAYPYLPTSLTRKNKNEVVEPNSCFLATAIFLCREKCRGSPYVLRKRKNTAAIFLLCNFGFKCKLEQFSFILSIFANGTKYLPNCLIRKDILL